MTELLPLYDEHGRPVLDSETNEPIGFTDLEARVLIGQALVTVCHGRSKRAARYLVLRVSHDQAVKLSKVEKMQATLRQRGRLPVGESYCEAEYINGTRFYAHVAHRCSAVAPHRPSVDASCM